MAYFGLILIALAYGMRYGPRRKLLFIWPSGCFIVQVSAWEWNLFLIAQLPTAFWLTPITRLARQEHRRALECVPSPAGRPRGVELRTPSAGP
jgi:hypothetical protein